jgi:FtsP/CotA-like multicopper oxidase with cupredoxin domain
VKALTLLTVRVTKDGSTDMKFMPAAPPLPNFLGDVTDEEVTGTKVIKFASSPLGPPVPGGKFPSQHTIDGKKFDGELGVVVALNRAEEWKIVNETYPPANANWISHPFHIHINPFQITEEFDPKTSLSNVDGVGTVSLTKPASGNQATVTGEGTNFKRDFRVGDWIWITSNGADPAIGPSMVSAIASETEELTIDNAPPGPINGATYQVVVPLYTVDRAGARPGQCVIDPKDPRPCTATEPAQDRKWWDVFSIPSGSTFVDATGAVVKVPGHFRMRSRFVDYSGYYVIHCHILAHEDRGMMTVVEVAPLQTPYAHH